MKRSASRSIAGRDTFVRRLFCACVFLVAAILLEMQTGPASAPSPPGPTKKDSARRPPPVQPKEEKPKEEKPKEEKPKEESPPAPPLPGSPPVPERTSAVTDADLQYIAARNLLIPVANVTARQLRDTFKQARSEGREHNAIDIMAPQGTPVLATTDGVVIKLFQSERGGVTLYELDPSARYVYYYGHLMRYAEGVAEGRQLRRGEVIGYVGDTGNAGAGNYHLHFAISKVTSPRKWSVGDPINPYPLLVRK